MTSTSQYHDLDYTFAKHFATLRVALGLTQSELAQRLGVTERSIQRWEGGTRYPRAEYLKAFLTLCIKQQTFSAGREIEQARMLWKAARLKVLFEEHWILGLLHKQQALSSSSPTQESAVAYMPRSIAHPIDWGEDTSEVSFYGRENEQAQLTSWIREERCRLIALLGMGGIGKSSLAVTLLHQLAPSFTIAIFRSVRDAIPCEELVEDLIQKLAPEPLSELPALITPRITLLIDILQKRRCLVVLDNVETLLQEGEQSGRYRVGYEEYGRLFERIGTTQHQSCVVITSREKPAELKPLEGNRTPVRSLHLAGLDKEAAEQILLEKRLRGDAEVRQQLIDAYSGNPLALKIVTETIRELFTSEIAQFLAEGQIIFQGVRALLAQQFARLPFLEQSVLFWLAIVREPVNTTSLLTRFVTQVPKLLLLEALEDLRRRSLVEHGQQRSQFTLQSVVMEFVTDELVKKMAREVQRREPDALLTYALSLASTKEYIRQTQERLMLAPVLFHLGAAQHRKSMVEQQLRHCLDLLRSYDLNEQGYGPTNISMLLRHLNGHLQGIDLSGCGLREAYLQGVQMQDASLRGSLIRESIFTDAFGLVTEVAVRHDGTYWAVSSLSGDVRVFLGESSTPSLVLQAHSRVGAMAFSPDGTRLATVGRDDQLVKIWHLEHATLLATLQGHHGIIQRVAFAPDGTQLATCDLDGAVCIWDLVSFQLRHLLHSHDLGVASIAWSPDGLMLASTGDDGIRLWNPQSGTGLHTLEDAGNAIYQCAFSPDSKFLVSGGTDQFVKLWDVASGKCLQRLSGHSATILAVTWSPDGHLFASGAFDNTVRIWQANSTAAQLVFRGHTDYIQSITFNADGTKLFSGSADCSVRLWELASGYCVRFIQGYMLSCDSVAWSPRGDILATATSDALIILWDPTQGTPLRVLQGHTQSANTVTWSPDGLMLASGGNDQTIHLWNASTGENLQELPAHTDYVRTVSWHPAGQLIASGGFSETLVRVWDREKQQERWVGEGHKEALEVVEWSPDGTCLASSGDSSVRLWNAEDGSLLKVFEGHQKDVYDLAWSPDSKQLASCSGGEVFIWNVASGTPLQISLDPAHLLIAVAWSPRGDRLLAGGRGGAIYWLETENWTCLAVRKEHESNIRSIRISPDGNMAASAGNNGIIIIWGLEQAIPLHTLRPDRPYERLDISGIQGITDAQKTTLRALGAVGDA